MDAPLVLVGHGGPRRRGFRARVRGLRTEQVVYAGTARPRACFRDAGNAMVNGWHGFHCRAPAVKLGGDTVDSILTVTDYVSKMVVLIPLPSTATAVDLASPFFRHVVARFGMPTSIVSDRDPKFTSAFEGFGRIAGFPAQDVNVGASANARARRGHKQDSRTDLARSLRRFTFFLVRPPPHLPVRRKYCFFLFNRSLPLHHCTRFRPGAPR